MSNLSNKLSNTEVVPPETNWQKIANELDSDLPSLGRRLNDVSISNTPDLWERIQSELDNSHLKQVLNNIEIAAPASSWNAINTSLDENYFQRLENIEVTPPSNLWNRIAEGLHEEAPVIKMTARNNNWLKYAAAVIVLLGVAAILFLNRAKETTSGLASNNMVTPSIPAGKSDTSSKINIPVTSNEDIVLTESKSSDFKSDRRPNKSVASNALYAYNAPNTSIADRYVMLMTPEGSIIRMSKKLGDLICCVSGEEADSGCKDQLKRWQAQMAALPAASSPSNFLDILSLVNSLDETEL